MDLGPPSLHTDKICLIPVKSRLLPSRILLRNLFLTSLQNVNADKVSIGRQDRAGKAVNSAVVANPSGISLSIADFAFGW